MPLSLDRQGIKAGWHASREGACATEGRRDDAIHEYRAAWSLVVRLRERTKDSGIRAGLTMAPLVRELEDLARG